MSGNQGREAWQGWRKNQGWRRQEGVPDDSDIGATLVEGLLRNRESLQVTPQIEPTEPAGVRALARPRARTSKADDGLPEVDSAEALSSCARDVRARVLLAELFEGLVIKSSGSNAAVVNFVAGNKKSRVALIERPGKAVFEKQLGLVDGWAVRRAERAPEIVSQMGPFLAYWESILNLSAERTTWTLELCNLAMEFAAFVVQRVKHILACPRPGAYSRKLQPMIPVPAFTALPSGHATEAFMLAHLLTRLCGLNEVDGDLLQRQAERIATNRVVAGVHFPVDSVTGRMLGHTLAEYFEHRCLGTGWAARSFHGTKFDEELKGLEFSREPMTAALLPEGGKLAPHFVGNDGTFITAGPPSDNLAWLWDRARGGSA